jgi:glycosyltransferase involved in cell wall biosynthesis
MRIAYVTPYDARCRHQWSGIGYAIHAALTNAGADVRLCGPLKHLPRCRPQRIWKRMASRLWKPTILQDRSEEQCRSYAVEVDQWLVQNPVDCVLSPGTLPVAYLKTRLPVVTWTDATFHSLVDFYAEFCGFTPAQIRLGDSLERRALVRANLTVYSSQWAADSAQSFYHVPSAKLLVLPFGANLPAVPTRNEVEQAIASRTEQTPIQFLSIGKDWNRKGFDHAVQLVGQLREFTGLDIQLTLIGAVTSEPLPSFVHVVPSIDKWSAEGAGQFASLLAGAVFHLMMSQADCTPIAIGEAMAYGVPTIAMAVGGIPEMIQDGHNGILLKQVSLAPADLHRIAALVKDRVSLCHMSIAARSTFEERHTWSKIGTKLLSRLEDQFGKGRLQPVV